MKRYFSFTLVEILAVTVLVSLLAAIGFAGYGYAMNASRRSATESLIQQISAGLENFKIKNGYYPLAEETSGKEVGLLIGVYENNGIIERIVLIEKEKDKQPSKVEASTAPSSKGTVLNKNSAGLKSFLKNLDQEKLKKNLDGNGYLVDSWGGYIRYRYPGSVNKTGFDLLSAGSDGKFGKDSKDYPLDDIKEYKDDSGEWACDDISNFMDK